MFEKVREFLVDEEDLIMVLKAINKHVGYFNGDILTGDKDSKTWFVSFSTTNKKYGLIMNDLNKFGEFKLQVSSKGKSDVYFERHKNIEVEDGVLI